jgi:hypothetical protein
VDACVSDAREAIALFYNAVVQFMGQSLRLENGRKIGGKTMIPNHLRPNNSGDQNIRRLGQCAELCIGKEILFHGR